MNARRLFLSFLLLICMASASRVWAASEWRILQVGGPFHGDEIKPDLSLQWYGLFPKGEAFLLKKVKVGVRLEQDPILDRRNRKTGKRVSIDLKDEPLFLVGTRDTLPEGEVAGGVPDHTFIEPAASRELKILRKDCRLSAEGGLEMAPGGRWWLKDKRYKPYRILLNEGGASQILSETDSLFRGSFLTGPGAHPYVEWAGDLDRDGRMDILLNQASDNVTHWILYLSSKAKSGELVGKVAELQTTGC